ncbi:hypothetical protein [Kitasatospora purpeofusca]|uniref:hypothetical protein n=1 Tax=Kitasatospora purpeofusca TaxID=67352 RepID=UPI0036A10140
MSSTITGHRATLSVYLVGTHEIQPVRLGREIFLTMPSARLRFQHPHALLAAYRAWLDAERLAAATFDAALVAQRAPGMDDIQFSGHLTFAGPVPGVHVDARPAEASPTGAGQIRLQLGALTLTVGDLDAFRTQMNAWTFAYRLGHTLWPEELPALEQVRAEALLADVTPAALATAA